MKRIFFNILLIHMTVMINSQKFSQDQISFSSQLQTPNSIFSSDRSIYLSPASQTPIPFYSINNMNKFNSNFLTQSQSKVPSHFSTPFSVILSTTRRSNTDDDDDDDDDEHNKRYNYRNLVPKFPSNNHMNHTLHKIDTKLSEKRDPPANSRINLQSQYDKIHPNQYITIGSQDTSSKQNNNFVQNPAARRMIVTSEIQRSDRGPDQVKAGSIQNTQYVQAPGVFISSTTEPAIPILRLSNEMDLDGSFSYEALGADQTHYVQHSRMENLGTDKEEQVVEGSYSYVGDDGRTYTVHYVADSNGYRATGEHLPSPPPIPEIIQRAVQYNLAEEARRPPQMKASWENDENEYQIKEESKHHPFNIPLPRNLFTGKTPEAFSFDLAHNGNMQSNLVTASSFHIPTKSNHETSHDQLISKMNIAPIAPQITFLATKGAHSPSLHQQQSQPNMQKPDNTDKLQLPQLMNYEAEIKEPERDGNKGLWRWQYGLNTNGNQITNKNSISRSSAEGDDIIINFSDMTPEQYTKMIQTQMSTIKAVEPNNMEEVNENHYFASKSNTAQRENDNNNNNKTYSVTIINNSINDQNQIIGSTQTYDFYDQEPLKFDVKESENKIYHYINPITDNPAMQPDETDKRSKIISLNNFAPRSQMVTQSYNFEQTQFEPTKVNKNNENSTNSLNSTYKVVPLSSNNEYKYSQELAEEFTTPLSISNTDINVIPFNYYQSSEQSSFKPIKYNSVYTQQISTQLMTTTEPSVAELIKDNIFLKNLFKTPYPKEKLKQDFAISEENNHYQLNNPEPTTQKPTKLIEITENPLNEFKNTKTKPFNINDVLNYVVLKNHFESAKTKPKSKSTHTIQYINHLNEKEIPTRYIPINKENKSQENSIREDSKEYAALNRQQQQELRGIIKNYKVLQRQKNIGQKSQMLYEPQRHIKAFHPPGLPPLGRAGPSLKSYLPPTYT